MAAKRSAKQLAPLGLFVERLYALGGYATWKEFAEDAGVSAPQVSDFKTSTAEPSGLNLLKMIEAAARRGEGDSDAVAAAVQSLPPDPLATLAAAVVEIGKTQKEILRRLPAPGAVQESAAPVAPRRKAADE